jgi:hypothetical protein
MVGLDGGSGLTRSVETKALCISAVGDPPNTNLSAFSW